MPARENEVECFNPMLTPSKELIVGTRYLSVILPDEVRYDRGENKYYCRVIPENVGTYRSSVVSIGTYNETISSNPPTRQFLHPLQNRADRPPYNLLDYVDGFQGLTPRYYIELKEGDFVEYNYHEGKPENWGWTPRGGRKSRKYRKSKRKSKLYAYHLNH